VIQTHAVDLSPLVFNAIEVGQRRLETTSELRFTPHLDEESRRLYVVEDAALDLCVHAASREELADEIAAHLLFAWDAYAKADADELTPKAQELRDALRATFTEG
jgi:hypothetical protein